MNLAFTTLFLIICLLPGLIFLRSFFSGAFTIKTAIVTTEEFIIFSILPSLFIHTILFFILENRINWETIGLSALRTNDSESIKFISKSFKDSYSAYLGYVLISSFLAMFLGHSLRFLIRNFKLDLKYSYFRFAHRWRYYLTGEYLDFPQVVESSDDFLFSWVDILINTNSGSYIYSGILENFYLKEKIGFITLTNTRKTKIDDYQDSSKQSFQIPGDIITIPFDQIVNINITYYNINNLEEVEEAYFEKD